MGKMLSRVQRIEAALLRRYRRPAGWVERGSFWLFLCFAPLLLLSFVPGALGNLSGGFAVLALIVLAILLLILAFRWVSRRLLWTVRNRLIVTCLLMGLAPVVLFGLLAGMAAYIFSGQFATNTASAALNESLLRMKDRNAALTGPIGHAIEADPNRKRVDFHQFSEGSVAGASGEGLEIAAWRDGSPIELAGSAMPSLRGAQPLAIEPLPAWVQPGFNGLVEDGGSLYLRSVGGYRWRAHTVLVLVSAPLTHDRMNEVAQGLGSVRLIPGFSRAVEDVSEFDPVEEKRLLQLKPDRRTNDGAHANSFTSVQGGTLTPATHLWDTPVLFTAPLHCVHWQSGAAVPALVGVASRPNLLYQRLFSSSVRIGAVVRIVLVSIAVLFSLLELFAFLMAVRLSRTITHSIADLYGATTEIDRGNLAHRIRVERRDQLGALATSFNTMAGSLADLVEQQREKERLLSELEIAQEVQNNLFPQSPVHLPGFELHGVCKPARTVSGDYYDFILEAKGTANEGQLCLALGDISGKGISAALLMASLHAAVRAYRLAGDQLEGARDRALEGGDEPAVSFASPGKLLSLLNRHLYTSTQPEKYATLFFACYSSSTRRLTYSNGGQLPPLVLCADGSVKRLDRGGSVVGLLDGLAYQEATISLDPGDILIAYSDGVTEPENEFGEFGEGRLLEVIRSNRHQSLAIISNHAMRALRSWIGDAEQPDDITLVLARQS
jgi:sigma-B regulation protein RsbU (phosphoserine phosphatase)